MAAQTWYQKFLTNPITANLTGDLLYFARSPYAAGDDVVISWDDFSAQFAAAVVGGYLPLSGGTMTGDITFNTGKAIRTNTSAGNTLLLQAYDVNGVAYITFGTLTANNTPTFDLNPTTFNIDSTTQVNKILDEDDMASDSATALATQQSIKAYVDTIAAGLSPGIGVYAASTADLNATYLNGVSGVGATLTNAGALDAFSVDGVSPPINSRILVKNQSNGFENGVYVLTTVGSGAVAWILTRASDYNQAVEITPGDLFGVDNGTVNALSTWYQTATITTIGVDSILFSSFFLPASFFKVANNLSEGVAATMRTNLGLGTIATQDANLVSITGGTVVGLTNLEVDNIQIDGDSIIHLGDTNNKIVFGTDTQDFQTGGSSRLDLSDTGVRMGGANSRVTTILDEDNMASDSATALATQQSIKAYVDSMVGGASPLTTKGDLFTFSTVNARLPVGVTNGMFLQVLSTEATGLDWSAYTMPAADGTNNQLLKTNGAGVVSFASTAQLLGTDTNDSASAGNMGELISSVIANASATSLTNNTAKNVTSISLTAGDWDVFGNIRTNASGNNLQNMFVWSSTTSASVPDTSLLNNVNYGTAVGASSALQIPTLRYSLSGTTTVYLSVQAGFASGTVTACGGIYARRRR